MNDKEPYFYALLWEVLELFASFRSGMLINEALVLGEYIYYRCPRCCVTLDRDFVSYCDRCGQKLDWTKYKSVKLSYPLHKHD